MVADLHTDTDMDINNYIIELYNLSESDVRAFAQERSLMNLKMFTMNMNFLRIVSGLSSLETTYSS
jgi:hypothetical protein